MDLRTHLKQQCSKRAMDCPLGCGVNLKAEAMEEHCKVDACRWSPTGSQYMTRILVLNHFAEAVSRKIDSVREWVWRIREGRFTSDLTIITSRIPQSRICCGTECTTATCHAQASPLMTTPAGPFAQETQTRSLRQAHGRMSSRVRKPERCELVYA